VAKRTDGSRGGAIKVECEPGVNAAERIKEQIFRREEKTVQRAVEIRTIVGSKGAGRLRREKVWLEGGTETGLLVL